MGPRPTLPESPSPGLIPASADRTGEEHTRLPEEPERAFTWAVVTSSRPRPQRPGHGCGRHGCARCHLQAQPGLRHRPPRPSLCLEVILKVARLGRTWRCSRPRPTGRRGVMPTSDRPTCCRRPALRTSPSRPSPPARSRRDA